VSQDGPEDDQDGVQQRTVSASDSEPVRTAAPNSVFALGGAVASGDRAIEPDPPEQFVPASTSIPQPPQPEEEKPMPRNARRTRRKPIPMILQLLAGGELPKKDIGEKLELAASVLYKNLGKLKDDGLVALIGDNYRITKAGREALGSDATEAKPDRRRGAAGRRSSAHKRMRRAARAQASEVDTSQNEAKETAEATFRCAVMSDGCFFITKEGVSLELNAEEHAQMLHYLERMAEAASA
jgi:DNA-binding PadR family transcriptional regulator